MGLTTLVADRLDGEHRSEQNRGVILVADVHSDPLRPPHSVSEVA
jgi:hypothetical protein